SGCEARGLDTASALEIWRQLASFSGYSFCKAHSASFATLSYQVAWLKAHYPAQFMAAVLDNGGGFYGARAYISECERLGIAILPPDINHSGQAYRAEREEVRLQSDNSGEGEVRLQSDNRDQGSGTRDQKEVRLQSDNRVEGEVRLQSDN